jgi:hypothetical protein
MTQSEKLQKVLEVLISKLYLNESEDDYDPEIYIRDIDIKHAGMTFHTFNTCLNYLSKLKVFEIAYASQPFEVPNNVDFGNYIEENLTPPELERPDLRFKLYIFGNPWKVYDELNKNVPFENISTEGLAFDEGRSILSVNGLGVKIARQSNKSIDHFILKYIFENDPKEVYTYVDLRSAQVYDNDVEETTYLNACKNLNKKIKESTDGKIEKFLIFGNSADGSVQINPIYLG